LFWVGDMSTPACCPWRWSCLGACSIAINEQRLRLWVHRLFVWVCDFFLCFLFFNFWR
jgi:hypothetical protein